KHCNARASRLVFGSSDALRLVLGAHSRAPGTRQPAIMRIAEVQGSGFKVQGSRFKVQGSRFKVQSSRFRVQGSRFRVQGSTFRFSHPGHHPPWVFFPSSILHPPSSSVPTRRPLAPPTLHPPSLGLHRLGEGGSPRSPLPSG